MQIRMNILTNYGNRILILQHLYKIDHHQSILSFCLYYVIQKQFLPNDLLFFTLKDLYGFPFQRFSLVTKTVPLLDFVYGLNDFKDIN